MFRYSICDPLKEEIIEMGDIEKHKILGVLDEFPWMELLGKMKNAPENEVYFSPSLEFENKLNKHAISISIIEEDHGIEFYIFYQRPKLVSKFFGLKKGMNEKYLSDRTGQNINDVKDAVTALINDDLETLEKRWG